MTSDTPPKRRGRPPLGDRALTKTEAQARWRKNAAKKGASSKTPIVVHLDDAMLERLNACATKTLQCNRSEAIRCLLNARMDQLDRLAPALASIESDYHDLNFSIFKIPPSETHSQLLEKLRSGFTMYDLLSDLQELRSRAEKQMHDLQAEIAP